MNRKKAEEMSSDNLHISIVIAGCISFLAYIFVVAAIAGFPLTSDQQDLYCVVEEVIGTERLGRLSHEFWLDDESLILEEQIRSYLDSHHALEYYKCKLDDNYTRLVTRNINGVIYKDYEVFETWDCEVTYRFNTTETNCLFQGYDCVRDGENEIVNDFDCVNGNVWTGSQNYICLNDYLCVSYNHAQTGEPCEVMWCGDKYCHHFKEPSDYEQRFICGEDGFVLEEVGLE